MQMKSFRPVTPPFLVPIESSLSTTQSLAIDVTHREGKGICQVFLASVPPGKQSQLLEKA